MTTLLLIVGCTPPQTAQEPLRAVRVMTVGTAESALQHQYAAEVRARTESRLGFRVAGKVVSRRVEIGQQVAKGEELARLDAADLKLGQQAAEAGAAAARVNVELAEAEFKRFRELREQGFISAWELERRETALKSARAQAAQVVAQADVQGNQASYARLLADSAGVVTAVDVEPGMVVAAGSPVVRLAHDGPRDVVFSVPEDRIGRLRELQGKPGGLGVVLWGAQDKTWPAAVREVSPAADPVTRTFLVKADIGAAVSRLGQTATVTIAEPARPGIFKLPLAAVFEQQGKPTVWLLDRAAMTVRPQAVAIAGADGNDVVVAQGLQAGQTVVTAGVHVLTPGQKVRLFEQAVAAR